MAFNLNKNGGSEGSGNSKFNLSKDGIPAETANAASRKSNGLLYVGAGILLVSIVGWYFLFNNGEQPVKGASSLAQIAPVSDSLQTTQTNTNEGKGNLVVNEDSSVESNNLGNVASLNNKVPVSFANGATTFEKVDQSIVDELLSFLAANSGSSVEVRGYASSEGSLEMNRNISQARADAFKDYLLSRNISPSRITAIGKGIENPIASNSTEAGRRKNRRVEVSLR